MAAITWNEVLARTDLVGGDIETQEDGMIFRGPISSVEEKDGSIFFHTEWVAKLSARNKWKKWNNTSIGVNMGWSTPSDVGNGRIAFSIPYIGMATIFPKGGSKLDPAKVLGLEEDSWEEPL